MGTRAYIGIKDTDNSVRYIYNQCDGGLYNLGHLLRKYFKNVDDIDKLILNGDVSSVQTKETYHELINDGYSDPAEWNEIAGCMVHDLAGKEDGYETTDDFNAIMGGMICYGYLYDTSDGVWYYTKGNGLNPLRT